MHRVLITSDYLRPGDAVDLRLRDHGLATVHEQIGGGPGAVARLIRALASADGALIANDPMTAEVLAQAPRLKAIVRTGVGYDSVDIEAAARHGITVSNLPGINANAVAEYTLGLILAAARRLIASAEGVAAGRWPREDGHELRGATLGLVGFGSSARAVVPLARAFGMRILAHTHVPPAERDTPDIEFVDLPDLLSAADYVSLHTALTPTTRNLIDGPALTRMKRSAILINTARGAIVDEKALVAAVRDGVIAGAALDVVRDEPLPADSPLRGVPGITVYSHLAGQTAEARAAAGAEGAEELIRALEGGPANCVNADLLTFRRLRSGP